MTTKSNYCLILVILLCFTHFSKLSAQLDLQIQASRTTGTAPLYVFFDATSTTGLTDTNDLVNADFHWNFDQTNVDPNGDWETIKGMVAGHVFEEAGTYTVQCTVIAPDGTTDTETTTITVSAFSGTTYYVSTSGDDTNDGLSESTPWQTANYAFSQLSSNERILFNRGETFTNVHYDFQNLTGGKMIIGAYGSGNKPILSGLAGEDRMLQIDNVDDITFMDIHTISNTPNAESYNFDVNNCSEILYLNMELEGAVGIAIVCLNSDILGIFDTYYHDFGVLGTYTGSTNRFSLVGNTIDNLIGTPQPEHGIRVQGGEKQFLAHNTLTNLIDTKSAITIRGDGQRHVMLYKNKMDRIMTVIPQNAQTIADIDYVTIEGNYIGQNTDYTGSNFENSFNGIRIEATNIAVRNNVIDGYNNAISIGHDGNGVVSGSVDVYHNTFNWRAVSPISLTSGQLVRVQDVSYVKVHNNFITAPTIGQGNTVLYSGTNTHIWETNNVISTTTDYSVNPLPGSEADANDISNYKILSSSAAINAGRSNVPVFFDVDNNARDASTPDIGAFEYQTVVPVELLFFEASTQNEKVLLKWKTATEINSDYFEIQRSNNGIDFIQIGVVDAAGNSISPIEYTFSDALPLKGINYYRLKMVDQDDSFEYSNIVNIQSTNNGSVRVFPNPTSGLFHLHLDEFDGTDEIIFELYNLYGQSIIVQSLTQHQQDFDISHLRNGVYYWRLMVGNLIVEQGKVIKI